MSDLYKSTPIWNIEFVCLLYSPRSPMTALFSATTRELLHELERQMYFYSPTLPSPPALPPSCGGHDNLSILAMESMAQGGCTVADLKANNYPDAIQLMYGKFLGYWGIYLPYLKEVKSFAKELLDFPTYSEVRIYWCCFLIPSYRYGDTVSIAEFTHYLNAELHNSGAHAVIQKWNVFLGLRRARLLNSRNV